jgi:dienelactone hydrolase
VQPVRRRRDREDVIVAANSRSLSPTPPGAIFKLALFILTSLLGGSGCESLRTQASAREARPLPKEIQEYYSYKPITASPVVRQIKEQDRYAISEVQLIPPVAGDVTNPASRIEPIQMLWYRPRTESPRPLILIAPILRNNAMFVEDFARLFAANGYHAVIVWRPQLPYDPDAPLTQVEEFLRAAIIRNRQALDWLLAQPGVDTTRVATFGISYGAIINAALAGVEPRAQYHVFVLAGAPLADIMMKSLEGHVRSFWTRARAHKGLTDQQLHDALRATIRSDPAMLAPYVRPDDVMMIIARFDRFVPTSASLHLREAFGNPDTVVVPLGHYTTVLDMPFLRFKVMWFFRKKLGVPSVNGNRGWIYHCNGVQTP